MQCEYFVPIVVTARRRLEHKIFDAGASGFPFNKATCCATLSSTAPPPVFFKNWESSSTKKLKKKRFIEDTVTKDFEPWFGDLKPKEFIDKLNRQIQCYNNRKPSYDEKSDDEFLCMVLGEVLIIMNIDSMINCWTCDDFMKRYKGLVVYLQELSPMKNIEEIKNIFTKCLLQMQTYLGAFLKWKPGNHKTNLPGNSKRTHTRYRTSKVRRVRPAIFLPSQ